jgi:hypothetical protein
MIDQHTYTLGTIFAFCLGIFFGGIFYRMLRTLPTEPETDDGEIEGEEGDDE